MQRVLVDILLLRSMLLSHYHLSCPKDCHVRVDEVCRYHMGHVMSIGVPLVSFDVIFGGNTPRPQQLCLSRDA